MAMQEPGRTKGFPCKHCGIVRSSMPSLLEHMESHSQLDEDRRFKCEQCGRGYRHAGSLANHKKTHEVGSFQCHICQRSLSNALALKSHIRIHTSQKKHSCVDCGKAFRLATQLATHEKVHLSRQARGRPSDVAAVEYALDEEERDYENINAFELEEQAACAFGGEQESGLNVKSEDFPGDEEGGGGGDRPFRCDQCDKTYRHHGSLINHKKSHTVGMFECSVCFKQLNNLAALHSHQRIHNKTKSGPESSSVEGVYAGTTPDQFSPPVSDAPVHFCHLCQVLFPNDEEFQEHIQMHNSSSMSFGLHGGLSEDHNVSYDRSVTQSPDSNFYSPSLNDAPSMPSSMSNHVDFSQSHDQISNGHLYSDHSSNETSFTINTQGEPSVMKSDVHNSALVLADSADDPTLIEESLAGDSDERRFKCQVCGKSYRHAGSLINHKRSHQTGIYQCSICRKSYPHLAALRSHLRIHKAHTSSFNLSSEGDWLSPEPLTLDNQQSCYPSQEDGEAGGAVALAQENANERGNGAAYREQFDPGFPQDRTVHLPHHEHLMNRHMCADCGETFADIAGIKSHVCPLLQQQQQPVSDGYNGHVDFQVTNGQCAMGNPGDHMEFQGLNGTHDQRYFGEQSYHGDMNGEKMNGGGGLEGDVDDEEEEEDDDDDGELYQCSVCGNRYTSMRALRSHLRGHTQSHGTPTSSGPSSMSSLEEEKEEDPRERQQVDGGLIICSTCGESFTKKQDLLAHQQLHDRAQGDVKLGSVDAEDAAKPKEEGQSIICGHCGIFCSSYDHLETHHCSAKTKTESTATNDEKADAGEAADRHAKDDADGGDRQYKCDQCGRSYRHAGSLLNHKKSHKTGVFRCFVCQKRFYNLLALKNHQRTHFDVKRHTCHECGKAFKIQKQLLNHLRIHKENQAKIQELNNQIQALMQMNGTGSEGGMHSLNANANQASTSCKRRRPPPTSRKAVRPANQTEPNAGVKSENSGDPRPYSCDQCGRTYRHAGSLVNHKNSHKTGEYYCSICNNTYSNQLAMKNHLRIHFALKKHCCQDCGKGFRVKRQLTNHTCPHLKKDVAGGTRGRARRRTKDFKCKECGQAFVTADQLSVHACGGSDGQADVALKKEERPFACNICNRSYRHAGSLLNHKNTHKTGHFSCGVCSKPFTNPMALRNHTRIHTQKKKYVCLTCGKAFRLASILHNHQKVHNRVASHFSCPACGKSFQGKSGLKRHRCQRGQDSATRAGVHHAEGGDKCFMCDLCGRSYRHAGSLLNHKKTHSENLHHCTLCLQTFPDPLTLQIHSQMKRHCCPECGKTFCLIAHLQSHMETHNKERTLVCSPCQQSFPSTASYQQHQELQHRAPGQYQPRSEGAGAHMQEDLGWGSGMDQDMGLQGIPKLVPAFAHMHGGMSGEEAAAAEGQADAHGSEEKSHVCEHCGRTYRHAGSLLNHKNSHKTGSFFCSVCQKEFSNLMALKNHRRIHTEPKRYQCLECGKAFRVSTQLICHRRIHTKEKPFSCLLCDKRFSSKSNLRHHQKMHQSTQSYESSFSMDANSFMDLDMGSFL
ncbi:zinc finger protein 646 [Osmerus eperlanus]|uniref:zinc finger protein 646 n=1 Tax=Osmerus eperlanus TaxID=29151 RepID=UPI002E140873